MPVKPAYQGEAQLVRWAESDKAGRTVTLRIDEDSDQHAFKGLQGGQRFAVVVMLVDDNEELQDPETAKKRGHKAPTKNGPGDSGCTTAREPHAEPAKDQDRPRTPFRELPRGKQAVLKCKDADFQQWLRRKYPESWSAGRVSTDGDDEAVTAWIVKAMCGLSSRGDLSKDEFPAAHATWDQLLTDYDMRNYTR